MMPVAVSTDDLELVAIVSFLAVVWFISGPTVVVFVAISVWGYRFYARRSAARPVQQACPPVAGTRGASRKRKKAKPDKTSEVALSPDDLKLPLEVGDRRAWVVERNSISADDLKRKSAVQEGKHAKVKAPRRNMRSTRSVSGEAMTLDDFLEASPTALNSKGSTRAWTAELAEDEDEDADGFTTGPGLPSDEGQALEDEKGKAVLTHRSSMDLTPDLSQLSASGVGVKSSPVLSADQWNFLCDQTLVDELNQGKTIFSLVCRVGNTLTDGDKKMMSTCVNLSCFEDETVENNTPRINPYDATEMAAYTVVLTKTQYILPKVNSQDITVELFTNPNYHRACQPGSPTIYNNVSFKDTFRMTKILIPYIFKITIQFRVSELSPEQMSELALVDGLPATKGLLLERTKRDISSVDATRKVRSIILYNDVPGGVLVRNTTVAMNTAVPSYGASIVNNLGTFGAKEAWQTAELTRRNLPILIAKLRTEAGEGSEGSA